MKDQINRLARGEFEFETPSLTISESGISANIHADDVYKGEFSITGNCEIKGIVYSGNGRVTVENSNFIGVENLIRYTVDTTGVKIEEVLEGKFDIVSSGGEFAVPFSFKVVEKTIDTSMGQIYNIFHFANMAQFSPEDAKALFVSPEFPDIFLKYDLQLKGLYQVLRKGSNIRNSIEEFLIAIRKKSQIVLKVSQNKKVYKNFNETIKDIISIQKSTWGYIELSAESDADFIMLSKNRLDADDFVGNKYELEYILEKKKMHAGKNYGKIIITASSQTTEIEIEVWYRQELTPAENEYHIYHKERRRAIFELFGGYIEFRTKRISLEQWIEGSNRILNRVRGFNDEDVFLKLVQAQIFVAQNSVEEAKWLLENVKEEIMQDVEQNVALYCYFLYIHSLVKKEPEYSADILKIVKKYYENGHDEWQLLWIIFYMDEEYDRNKSIKLARIKEQFYKGCRSPILYLEACNILNTQPMLLRILNNFELQIIYFGCKHHILHEKTAKQICELCKNEKNTSGFYLRMLEKVYHVDENDDILSVYCSNLIRNNLVGEKYAPVYEESITSNLRITSLYEYYLDSLNERDKMQFSKLVLLYFAYNSKINYEKKAFLYAGIIFNKKTAQDIYLNYASQMEQFALEQLKQGKISENLIMVYKDFWGPSILNENTAKTLSKVMFTYKITCGYRLVRAVIIKHKELKNEVKVNLINGTAYVQMYTDNCAAAFELENGERTHSSIPYEIERLCSDTSLVSETYQLNPKDMYLELYFCESSTKYKKQFADLLQIQNRLLQSDLTEDAFKKEITESIIQYYYYEYVGDEFRSCFSEIGKEDLTEMQAARLAEVCIINGMYEDAYALILRYGYRKIKVKVLFKLCRNMIETTNYKFDEFLLGLAGYVFTGKKYDDIILEYLVSYYNQTSQNMFEVWTSCMNFNTDPYELEERLITQVLFTNTDMDQFTQVFERYYSKGAKERVVEACMAVQSYKYFVKKQTVDEQILKIAEARALYDCELLLVCKLALIRYYSTLKILNADQKKLAQKLLYELCDENIILKCYKKFAAYFTLPYNVADKTVIEYRTNPKNKVEISFCIKEKDTKAEYIKERMKNSYEGVFTKEFTLFYGETLQYYITEIIDKEEKPGEHQMLVYSSINPDSTEGRFDYLNDMLASKELHDIVTLKKLMHGYCVQNHVIRQIFKPL